MARSEQGCYEFGPYRLDASEKVLFEEGRPVALTPKAVETPLILVSRHGHVVGKDELMRAVWPDTCVEENNLTQNISALRRVLGKGGDGRHFIETVPRRGYRFVAELAPPRQEGSGAHPSAGVSPMPAPRRLGARWWAALVGGLAALTFVLLIARAQRVRRPDEPFARMRIASLTSSGNVTSLAASPDGRRLALALDDKGRQALWMRQLSTASGVMIIPPAETEYWGLTFTPDGQFVYAVSWEPNRAAPALLRVPVLGGSVQRLPNPIGPTGAWPPDGRVTFSPDGKHLAYLVTARDESRLVVATAEGTEPRTLATRRGPDFFATLPVSAPAWSPDGATIVAAVTVPGSSGRRMQLLSLRVSDGAERVVSSSTWITIGRIAWLPGGKGLVLVAKDERWVPSQIWQVSIPDGATRRVTNDLEEYRDLGLAADARTLVAVQITCVSTLWLAPGGRAAEAKRVVTESGKFDGIEGMSWTPNGGLVYRSRAAGNWDLWMVDLAEQTPRRLTFDPSSELHPSVSPDGDSVVFVSDRSGRNGLFRMPLERGDALQVTDDAEDPVYPVWSGDGRWVVFQSGMTWFRPVSIWKVSPSGGRAALLAGPTSIRPAASHDGRWVAYYSLRDGRWLICVVPIDGGPPVATYSIPPNSSRTLRWMPDDRAVAYIVTVDGVSNVWKQALQGGAPEPVTDFMSDRMFDFAWSRDGRMLAVVRAMETSDAVRITSFR
jgi:Tol biopolymer transport system component/DNA-binding winged helix-turn-helix (wHTH) protein